MDNHLDNRVLVGASLLVASLVAWIVTVQRMRGMDAGPGTDLGGLGWFLGIWVTMMAAMMLPSAVPTVMLVSHVRRGMIAPVAIFVTGYLTVWTAVGVAAYGLYRAFVAAGTGWLAWDRAGPYVAGAVLAAAGLYQLTPLKDLCLRHCRSPLSFLLRPRSTLRLGIEHGAYCLGCCSGLMLALFALGVMSLFWMAVVGAAVLVEKIAPGGQRFSRLFALALVVLGVWVAAAPRGAPGLVQPGPQMARMK
jgi:predicted metal-binding membrane protein